MPRYNIWLVLFAQNHDVIAALIVKMTTKPTCLQGSEWTTTFGAIMLAVRFECPLASGTSDATGDGQYRGPIPGGTYATVVGSSM